MKYLTILALLLGIYILIKKGPKLIKSISSNFEMPQNYPHV